MGSMGVQRSWLGVALCDRVFSRKWVVLDNGVLWIHNENNCSTFAEEVIPLQDADICCPALDADEEERAVLAVRTAGPAGRVVYLRAESESEYRLWIAAVLGAARVWHARREVAALYRQDLKDYACALKPQSHPLSPEECRMRVVKCLTHFSKKCAELRQLTRRVYQTGDDVLPRFHRRAVNDAVEKVWRASERARSILERSGSENERLPAAFDAILALRDDVGAFITYCSLFRDLQTMLGMNSADMSLMRELCALRAALRGLSNQGCAGPAHRAALAALDAIVQRCWIELRDAPAPAAPRPSPAKSPPEDVMFVLQERQLMQAHPPPGRHSVHRMASRLKRDVSLRRASKRARSEEERTGQMEPLSISVAQQSEESDKASLPPSLQVNSTPELPPSRRPLPPLPAPEPPLAPGANDAIHPSTESMKYATLRLRPRASSSQDSNDHLELRIRRKTYTFGYCFSDDDDGIDGEPFVEPGEVIKEVGRSDPEEERARPSTPENNPLDIPVTPATPNGGGRRALWCETTEVLQSGVLERLSSSECVVQEAKFEVLSSEESYLRSLDMINERVNAIAALHDPIAISDHERDAVFSFLDSARACSMRFVTALRGLWSRDLLLRGLYVLVHREATASLLQYAVIVGMQPRAASVLAKIGSAEAGQLVPLLSLPAQRASRLPLLLAAILRRLDQRTSDAVICRAALDRLNHIVFECNESLRRAEHLERMCLLSKKLLAEKAPRKKSSSWRERKSSVLGRAKSLFQKSSSLTNRTKARTSTSSLLPLASMER